jgi:hypothetical protein
MKCQSFQGDVRPLIWEFIVENDKNGNDNDNKDKHDSEDDKDCNDNENVSVEEDDNACSPMKNNKRCKCSPAMVSLGMVKSGSDNVDMDKLYPNLFQALRGEDGFDRTNPSVQKSMRSLLSKLNNLLSTTYQHDVNGLSNNKISYVRDPWMRSNHLFLNTKE